MRCPQCFAIIPDTTSRCDCGREFTPEELSAVQAVLRKQAARARRRRTAVMCVVFVVLLLVGLIGWLALRH